MLQKVVELWRVTDFRLVGHSSGTVVVLAGADDILAQLEESQVTIGTIRGSRYVTPIKVILLIIFIIINGIIIIRLDFIIIIIKRYSRLDGFTSK